MTARYPIDVQQVKAGVFSVVEAAPKWLRMLAEMDDAKQLKECKAQASAIAAYLANRPDGSVKEYNAAVKVKARVEHRLGEVLAATVRHQGGRPKKQGHSGPVIPSELGNGKNGRKHTSKRTQQLARLPWQEIEKRIDARTEKNEKASVAGVAGELKKEEAAKERKARAVAAAKLQVAGFHHGDFREVAKSIPDGSVDLIFTDPPYDRKSLPLYGDLAGIAAAKLAEGGSLICYLGQYQMDEVLKLVTPHLRLWWTLAVVHTGQSARMREYGVVVRWKPLLWFVKGTRGDKQTFVDDAVFSSQEKTEHAWQQSLVEARYYVEKLTPHGGLVFDPFCGGGTTALACKELGRRFVTCDVDAESLALAKGRAA